MKRYPILRAALCTPLFSALIAASVAAQEDGPLADAPPGEAVGEEVREEQAPRGALGDEQQPSGKELRQDPDREVIYQRQVELSGGQLSTLIKDSASIVQRFLNEADERVPRSLVERAECVAVFPAVTKAALIVSGQRGSGVVTCRGPNGAWSRLGFLDLTGAGLGAQLGAKTTDLMLFFMSEKARRTLEQGRFSMGTDLSVAVGNSDLTKNIAASFPQEDVVAFAESGGAFIGASFDGMTIEANERKLKEFYDENARYQRVIATYDSPGHPLVVRDFIQLLPTRGAGS